MEARVVSIIYCSFVALTKFEAIVIDVLMQNFRLTVFT